MKDQVKQEYLCYGKWTLQIVAPMPHRCIIEKVGFFGLDVDKGYPVEICFPDGWTWHILHILQNRLDLVQQSNRLLANVYKVDILYLKLY